MFCDIHLFQRKCSFQLSLFMPLCTDYSGGFCLQMHFFFFFLIVAKSLCHSQHASAVPLRHLPLSIPFLWFIVNFLLHYSSSCDKHSLIICWKCAFLIENIICLECGYKVACLMLHTAKSLRLWALDMFYVLFYELWIFSGCLRPYEGSDVSSLIQFRCAAFFRQHREPLNPVKRL